MTADPIEELAVPYDPRQVEQKVRRRRGRVRSRLVGLVITVLFLVALGIWQRDAFGPALWILYAVLFTISGTWLLVEVLGWRQARRELAGLSAGLGAGLAVRIGRTGVQVGAAAAPWSRVHRLVVVPGGLGRSPRLRLEHDGPFGEVPLDQIDVLPATLDTTARAYSAGRFGVDLSALDV